MLSSRCIEHAQLRFSHDSVGPYETPKLEFICFVGVHVGLDFDQKHTLPYFSIPHLCPSPPPPYCALGTLTNRRLCADVTRNRVAPNQLRQPQRSPAKRRVVFDKGDGEEGEQARKRLAVAEAATATTTTAGEGGSLEDKEGPGTDGVEGDEDTAPTTVQPWPAASVIDGNSSTTESSTSGAEPSCTIPSSTTETGDASALPPLDGSTTASTEQRGEGGETLASIDNPEAEKESSPTVVVPSPEAPNGAGNVDIAAASISGGVANGAPPVGAAHGTDVVEAGKDALEEVPKEDPVQAAIDAALAPATATEAFPLGNAVDGDGDALMEDAVDADASEAAAAAAQPARMVEKSGGDSPTTPTSSQGEAIASASVAASRSAVAAVASPAPVTTAVETGGEGAKVVDLESSAGAAAAAEKKAANEAAEVAAAAAAAQTEAAADADKAAAIATRQKAKADGKRAKRECEEACLRLLKMRGDIVVRTRGWSIEQLLALRGGTLELGAAICGRGMPRAKVGSAASAVDILMRYVDQRLP